LIKDHTEVLDLRDLAGRRNGVVLQKLRPCRTNTWIASLRLWR
jgi:hypothetical protein